MIAKATDAKLAPPVVTWGSLMSDIEYMRTRAKALPSEASHEYGGTLRMLKTAAHEALAKIDALLERHEEDLDGAFAGGEASGAADGPDRSPLAGPRKRGRPRTPLTALSHSGSEPEEAIEKAARLTRRQGWPG